MYCFEIEDDLKDRIIEQLEITYPVKITAKYDIRVYQTSFDHEFGTEKNLETEVRWPSLWFSINFGKGLVANAMLNDLELRKLLSHTVYDKLMEEIQADHENHAVEAIEAYND